MKLEKFWLKKKKKQTTKKSANFIFDNFYVEWKFETHKKFYFFTSFQVQHIVTAGGIDITGMYLPFM